MGLLERQWWTVNESDEARLQRHEASVPVTLKLCQSVSLSICHVCWSFCLLLAPQRRRIMTSPAGSPFASPLSTSPFTAALPSGSFPHPLFLLSIFFLYISFLLLFFSHLRTRARHCIEVQTTVDCRYCRSVPNNRVV